MYIKNGRMEDLEGVGILFYKVKIFNLKVSTMEGCMDTLMEGYGEVSI